MLEVRLLGCFQIKFGKKAVSLTSRPAQSLFAFLILNAGTAYRREKLAGQLWSDSTEESARDYLRHALWRIRKALQAVSLASYLHADDLTISFDASSMYGLDAAALQKIGQDTSADELTRVLSAYSGELLPGFYEEWVVLEREHLRAKFEKEMGRLLDLLQDSGRWSEVLQWAEKWISLGERPEPAYRALMRAHSANGDMSKVAAIYERCVKSLRDFGVEPSAQTSQLYESLKSGKPAPEREKLPPSNALAQGASSNVPVPLTSFIGRQKELAEIAGLLKEKRLVTLVGPGGVGKTRLAIQTAHDASRKFKDGVYWVDLASLTDASLVPQALAKALKVRAVSNQPIGEEAAEYLRPRQSLVVLDNCEHLVMACAQLAEGLLSECKQLKILVTSREPLDILGETTWPVPSLSLPERDERLEPSTLKKFESVQLFVDRAALVQSDFELTENNANTVAQVCRRLGGLPLAIELAAARAKIMSPEEIARRLDDRFDLLTGGSRTDVPRHQTLRAAIDWSYDLLSDAEQTLFRRLSVFAGGFTLEVAEAIAAGGSVPNSQVIEILGQLINKSLVYVDQRAGKARGETRYGMLETIRGYGRQKLSENDEVSAIHDRHLGYYVQLAQESEPHIFGEQTPQWFARLDEELDNIRAAIDWANENQRITDVFLLLGSMDYFFFVHGPISEWQERLKHVLSLPGGEEPTLARAKALNGVGMLYWADINAMDGYPELLEALVIALQLDDRSVKAKALRNLGLFEHLRGNLQSARSLLEKSLNTWIELGPAFLFDKSWTLNFLGDVAFSQADFSQARGYYEQSTTIFREFKDKAFLGYAVRRLGQLAIRDGNVAAAIAMYRESLHLNIDMADLRGALACISAFAGVRLALGQLGGAAELFGAVHRLLHERSLFRLLQIDQLEFDRNLAMLRERLPGKPFEKAWERGQQMTLDQATEASTKIISK